MKNKISFVPKQTSNFAISAMLFWKKKKDSSEVHVGKP